MRKTGLLQEGKQYVRNYTYNNESDTDPSDPSDGEWYAKVARQKTRRRRQLQPTATSRLQEAWLGEAGLTLAYNTVTKPKAAHPPFHAHHSSGRDMTVVPGLRAHSIIPIDEYSVTSPALQPAPPPPPKADFSKVSEVVDAVRRCVFDMRGLAASVESLEIGGLENPGVDKTGLFQNLPGYAVLPMPTREWAEAVVLMKQDLLGTANSVDACLAMLYRLPSFQEGSTVPLLRVDDTLFPLVFLLQTLTHLRDLVADATAVRVNFFGTKELTKYSTDCSHAESLVLKAVDVIRQSLEDSSDLVADPRDSHRLGSELLAELVPCPGSRRFWVSCFSPSSLSVTPVDFIRALAPYAQDLLPGAAHAIVEGITNTLLHEDPGVQKHDGSAVTLCSFAGLFGQLSILDAIDTLAAEGVANVTYTAFITPSWTPGFNAGLGVTYAGTAGIGGEIAPSGAWEDVGAETSTEPAGGGDLPPTEEVVYSTCGSAASPSAQRVVRTPGGGGGGGGGGGVQAGRVGGRVGGAVELPYKAERGPPGRPAPVLNTYQAFERSPQRGAREAAGSGETADPAFEAWLRANMSR